MTTPGAELRRLRSLVADLDAVVWEADAASGRFTFVSQRAWDLLGYAPKLWIEEPSFWADHIHPDDRDRVVQVFLDAITHARPHDLEYRFLHRDGRTVWLRGIGHTLTDARGNPTVVRGLLVDITRQKLAEERRAELERRYRNLVEQLPGVVYLQSIGEDDEPGHILFVSPQVEQLLGVRPEEWLTDPTAWVRSVHPEDLPALLEAEREALRGDGRFRAEYRAIARDGREVWIHDEASLVRDTDGTPLYWQGVMTDVTERRRAEELDRALATERAEAEKLRELDRMKNTFLQAVSHDLRTPLASILGLAVTLEREDLTLRPEEAREMAARIAANARRLDRMVSDLLDLDRLSRGIVEPNLAPTDVGELVASLVAGSELVVGRRVEVEAPAVWAEVDAAKVERIVENLLANAVRHTPPETRIWVRVLPGEREVVIAVEDEGPGVPPDLRERIFEPFHQAPSATEGSAGVGIGLALVARFAELHGGRAWVEDREGGGASFRVRLPLRRAG